MKLHTANLEAEILQLSQLDRDQLDDAALEIQVNLECCWYDHGELPDYPRNPYDEFLWFAARIADYSSECPEYSVLCELTPRQTYLAAAWAFLDIVSVDFHGQSESQIANIKEGYRTAAVRLVDDVKCRPYALYRCGVRHKSMGDSIVQ